MLPPILLMLDQILIDSQGIILYMLSASSTPPAYIYCSRQLFSLLFLHRAALIFNPTWISGGRNNKMSSHNKWCLFAELHILHLQNAWNLDFGLPTPCTSKVKNITEIFAYTRPAIVRSILVMHPGHNVHREFKNRDRIPFTFTRQHIRAHESAIIILYCYNRHLKRSTLF